MTTGFLILTLIKHVGLIVAAAFILLTIAPVQELGLNKKPSVSNRYFLIAFFGFFGIIGTYGGNEIFNSVANLRAMAVITAGLYAGPMVGLGAGVIAGGHRFLIDPFGFSAIPCSLATILEGLVAGIISERLEDGKKYPLIAVLIGIVGETLHMGLVLVLSKPFDDAVILVKIIALPMIVGNSMGAGLFIHLIETLIEQREKRESTQAQKIFYITNKTVSHLRSGLNLDSARATAEIIYKQLSVAAVAITDESKVLAHIGLGSDHHLKGKDIRTEATKKVIRTGTPIFHKKRNLIGCNDPECPFYSAVIVPLKKGENIVGTLKFYGTKSTPLNKTNFEIAKGLTDLFSIQLELETIQINEKLLAHAEIRHLQAQINPHFLFNSLNTIASFTRTDSEKARELILDLSLYMRNNLDSSRGFIKLSEELEQIKSYFAIEKARFGEKINFEIDVCNECKNWPIPPLIIQPLIENAVRHGISCLEDGGSIKLTAKKKHDNLFVSVEDNGCGIDKSQIKNLFRKKSVESKDDGIGLSNCYFRLEQIYGPQYRLDIKSEPGKGTRISFMIPESIQLKGRALVHNL